MCSLIEPIENIDTNTLDKIEQEIEQKCSDLIVKGIYVVGSVAFGLIGSDMDIIVECQNLPSREKRTAIVKSIEAPFRVDINFTDKDFSKSRMCDLGFLVPYFDLKERKLYHRYEGHSLPFNFSFIRDESGDLNTDVLITYLRDKMTRVDQLILTGRSD